jgi:hypothetical protein
MGHPASDTALSFGSLAKFLPWLSELASFGRVSQSRFDAERLMGHPASDNALSDERTSATRHLQKVPVKRRCLPWRRPMRVELVHIFTIANRGAKLAEVT